MDQDERKEENMSDVVRVGEEHFVRKDLFDSEIDHLKDDVKSKASQDYVKAEVGGLDVKVSNVETRLVEKIESGLRQIANDFGLKKISKFQQLVGIIISVSLIALGVIGFISNQVSTLRAEMNAKLDKLLEAQKSKK